MTGQRRLSCCAVTAVTSLSRYPLRCNLVKMNIKLACNGCNTEFSNIDENKGRKERKRARGVRERESAYSRH